VRYSSSKRGLLVNIHITCERGRFIMTTIAYLMQRGKSYSEV